LGYNSLSDISSVNELTNLKELDLSGNQISVLPPLSELRSLTNLDVGSNGIRDISSLGSLVRLKTLAVNSNSILDVTPLANLTSLVELDLGSNDIFDISGLENLTNLVSLTCLENRIVSISPLRSLNQLSYLNLGRNRIADISVLKNLKQLVNLWLIGNQINDFSVIGELNNLTSLSIAENKVKDISFLKTLSALKKLHVQSNSIKNIGVLSTLEDLQEVNLSNNQIKSIAALKNLKKLTTLDLMSNPISVLPKWIVELDLAIRWYKYGYENNCITLFENPLKKPPIDIVKQGREAIIRYFKKIKREGIDYLFEAKLTLVGEGGAGKTSLQVRLLNSKAFLPKKDARTRGIKIYDWKFKHSKGQTHIAHIWDFGGQDVYYPVHRFFLTENSVFVLLASTRQTNHNFDYWIPTIYQFGGSSPIILGQTCHDGNKVPWNDLGYYLSNTNFTIIKNQSLPYHELNLIRKNEGLSKIKKTIIDQILQLPHYGKGVPVSWILIRNLLLEKSARNACISFETFKELCVNANPTAFRKQVDIEDCAQFLHSIGVILWYYNNDELKNWIVLQPEWAMNAVYKIIDDEDVQKRRGIILAKDFNRLWKEDCYEGMHHILKKMLEVFKIAFPKKHKKADYIIPARLLSMPIEQKWNNDEPFLSLEYKYDFMPKGMVNQVSAELSRFITADDQVWNNAVNFSNENDTATCQLEEDFYNRKISIKAKGRDARGFIMIMMNALKDITEGYKGVKPEIYVPCVCSKCIVSNKPTQFAYGDLLRWSADEESAKVYCNEGRESLPIESLLFNVGLASSKRNRNLDINKNTVRIFLASSVELREDREQFEVFVNRENKKLNKQGYFLELEIWEDFIDAMSRTRLQDAYNRAIVDCDIFISLFFSKVGKYTAEEFEQAFGQFRLTGKPFIYTYFKDDTQKMTQLNRDDINSKFDFEDRLKKLGHFPTIYKNMDDLKYQFKNQLDKILPLL
jgi:internalin A